MAMDNSALLELLDALKAAGVEERIRVLALHPEHSAGLCRSQHQSRFSRQVGLTEAADVGNVRFGHEKAGVT